MDSAAALEGARRYLSGLQPEDHHGDGVAQPPYRWRTHGGKDTIENRVLVHPNCHQQIHSQELDVGKPRPAKGVREA